MRWFKAKAPIRLKLLLAFGFFTSLLGIATLGEALLPTKTALDISCGLMLIALISAWWLREAIAVPYVTTVLRMEGLAAGDLASHVAYTDYTDCVGRLTRAMDSFKRAAEEQVRLNAQAREHATTVRGMAAYFQRLASGDLSAKIVENYPDEFIALKDGYNSAIDRLRELIEAVLDRAAAISTGTGQITHASEDLARRTEANAASLEEAAAAIAQMDQRLRVTASAAAKTVVRADGATGTVVNGRATTDAAVQAMNRVADSAKGIDSVIEGLDKIAFQTRVLAMNAAVEAGRAGEAGRGFAVVADLVSALAMRAEEEAGRAREQLTSTQTDIVAAVAMVQQVDGALAGIAADVTEVHGLLGNMAGDNQAQSSAVTQISAAVSTMDQSTQQNAAMVEETSAAARNLMGEVQALITQAKLFDVGGRTGGYQQSIVGPSPRAAQPRSRYISPAKALGRTAPAAAVTDGEWASF